MKKWVGVCLVLMMIGGVVWFALAVRRVMNHGLDGSERGHIYRDFFLVLDQCVESKPGALL